jgi:hypothetical protein
LFIAAAPCAKHAYGDVRLRGIDAASMWMRHVDRERHMNDNYDLAELVTLGDALFLLPNRDGKKPHISTLYRWRKGLRGRRLWTTRLGGIVYTHPLALREFLEATTPLLQKPAASRSAERETRTAEVLQRLRGPRGKAHV